MQNFNVLNFILLADLGNAISEILRWSARIVAFYFCVEIV